MNWDQIETKWTEMTQRVRAGAPLQAKGGVAGPRKTDGTRSPAVGDMGDAPENPAAEAGGPVTVE